MTEDETQRIRLRSGRLIEVTRDPKSTAVDKARARMAFYDELPEALAELSRAWGARADSLILQGWDADTIREKCHAVSSLAR